MATFVADHVEYLKSLTDSQDETVNERLRASSILSRGEFLQVQSTELKALVSFFGEKKFFSFQKVLLPHFSRKVPVQKRGLYDLPIENCTFSKMYGIKSHTEMICSILLPELLTKYVMKSEGIDRETAVSRIFGTKGGHTLYYPYMMQSGQKRKQENEIKPPSSKSRRKSSKLRKVLKNKFQEGSSN